MIDSALFVVLLAAQSLSPEVLQRVADGMAAEKAGRLDEAIVAFTRVAELAPALAAAHSNLGNVYMLKGDYAGAVKPLRQALTLNPKLAGAQQQLGYALLATGYAVEAIPLLEQTKSVDGLGIALFQAGRLAEAVGQLQMALDHRPNDPELLYYLGRASATLSKQSYDALRAAHPGAARTHQVLAEIEAVQRKLPDAEKEYREALRIREDTPGVRLGLGEIYAASGQWEKAEAELREEAIRRPGDAEVSYRLGSALLEQGKMKPARAELERANGLAPSMPETLYALGKACLADGDLAASEKHWLALLEIERETVLAGQAHFGLAGIYRRQGKLEKAERNRKEYERLRNGAGK